MTKSFSIYLNLLRALAAFLVFFNHYPFARWLLRLTVDHDLGFDAVVLFFVLSGYVISYAAEQVDKTAFNYVVNRVARILPVSIGAIIICMILLHFILPLRPELYPDNATLKHSFYAFMTTAFFVNRLWWSDIAPFGDVPYWSLTYEVWCYVIYGLALFVKRKRWLWISLMLLMTGPIQAIFLLMWLTGVAAYRLRDKIALKEWQTRTLFIVPIPAYWGLKLLLPTNWSYVLVTEPIQNMIGHSLLFAEHFAWGLILAPLIAIHLFAAKRLSGCLNWLENPVIAKPIRKIAGITFTLYLLHIPLTNIWLSLMPPQENIFDPIFKAKLYFGTLVAVVYIARLLEAPKPLYRKWVSRLFIYVANANIMKTKK